MLSKFLLCARYAVFLAGLWQAMAGSASAQEIKTEVVPYSVWLDFVALSKPNPPRISLPIWLESVQSDHSPKKKGELEQTQVRLRLRRVGLLNREIELWLFFEDLPGMAPSVSAWTETGASRFQSGLLGDGLGLPNSETVIVPVADTDYVEISVPGNGKTLRGAFLSTVHVVQTRQSLDLGGVAPMVEPFGNPWPKAASPDDTYLLGRLRATIDAEAVKLTSPEPVTWQIELARLPLVAVVSFEVLNVDMNFPPELAINGRPLGAVAPQWPDLADPGYRGEVRPLEPGMRFRYTGWLRCQKMVPARLLRAGDNELKLSVGRNSGSVAVRKLTLELKYNSPELDYTLTP